MDGEALACGYSRLTSGGCGLKSQPPDGRRLYPQVSEARLAFFFHHAAALILKLRFFFSHAKCY